MKALSFSRPWDYVILHPPFKDVENRPWRTHFRGRIYVHRAKSRDVEGLRWMMEHRHELGLGPLTGPTFSHLGNLMVDDCPTGLVGEIEVRDCVTESESPWFFGPNGLVLANPKAYEKPIPYKGKPGFFEVELHCSDCRWWEKIDTGSYGACHHPIGEAQHMAFTGTPAPGGLEMPAACRVCSGFEARE